MADYSFLPGLTSYYDLPGERDTILDRADALSDFVVETRKALGIDGRIVIKNLLATYKRLAPSLHRLAAAGPEAGIDVDALIYCYKRLPKGIAHTETIYCEQFVQKEFEAVAEECTAPMRRRKCYRLSEKEVYGVDPLLRLH